MDMGSSPANAKPVVGVQEGLGCPSPLLVLGWEEWGPLHGAVLEEMKRFRCVQGKPGARGGAKGSIGGYVSYC